MAAPRRLAVRPDGRGLSRRAALGTSGATWHDLAVTSRPATAQRLSDLARLRRIIAEMMAKGTYASINLAAAEQPYGVRDCALRDPAGNLLRIQELR
jgi:hypothetical protein